MALARLRRPPRRPGATHRVARGFPFWTKVGYFDAQDLDPDRAKNALNSMGIDADELERMTPEGRALAVAVARLQYGGGDEGPSGWSHDIGIPEGVKWSSGAVAGAEHLADEDEAFKDEVLGYADLREALEGALRARAERGAAERYSTLGDRARIDLAESGYDPDSAVGVAQFGDAVAVNGEMTAESLGEVEQRLGASGYEEVGLGGRVPSAEEEVEVAPLVSEVADGEGVAEDAVEDAAASLDWWTKKQVVPWHTSGYAGTWARRRAPGGAAEESRRRGARARESAAGGLEWHRTSAPSGSASRHDGFIGTVGSGVRGERRFLIDPTERGDWALWVTDPDDGTPTRRIGRFPTAADAKDAARTGRYPQPPRTPPKRE